MSTRPRTRLSTSFQPADLTAAAQVIVEEQEESPTQSNRLAVTGSDHLEAVSASQQSNMIIKLRERIHDLEHEHSMPPLAEELNRVRQEWQTSEDLLRQSQRDNEQKHETIEQYKVYVKDLEKLLVGALGPDWKMDHPVRAPLSQSTIFSASTPLPKPSTSALRRSVSVLPSTKRSSRAITRHASTSDLGGYNLKSIALPDSQVGYDMDETPTGAMRKLTASSARVELKPVMPQTIHQPVHQPIPAASTHPTHDARPKSPLPFGTMLEQEHVVTLLRLLASGTTSHVSRPGDVQANLARSTTTLVEWAEDSAKAREARLTAMLETIRSSVSTSDQASLSTAVYQ